MRCKCGHSKEEHHKGYGCNGKWGSVEKGEIIYCQCENYALEVQNDSK